MRIELLYNPRVIANAAQILPEVLRQWHNAHGAIPEPLAFLGETTRGGHRRYSLGGAVLVLLVPMLGHFGIGPAHAIPAANAIARFVRQQERRFAPHGADALEAMAEAGPMAVLTSAEWPSHWTARTFQDGASYAAAAHLPALAIRIDIASMFQVAADAVTRAAVAVMNGDEE
jgi:hypothetical protein